MSEARKHHYVPAFYLRNFAYADGLLWVYDRRQRTYRQLAPRSICCETDLYAIKREPRDRMLESVVLSQIDSMGATAIRDFIAGERDAVTIGTLAYFIGLQYCRLPRMARVISAQWEVGVKETMRLMAADPRRMQSAIDRYAQEKGESLNVSAEEMIADVKGAKFEVVITEVPFLNSLFRHAKFVANVITELGWSVLCAPEATGFITCDDPVVVVPRRGISDVGFRIPGTVVYFPLSRQMCVRLASVTGPITTREVDRGTVRTVNLNIAPNSERFIIGPNKAQLESIVLRSRSTEADPEPRTSVSIVECDEDSSTAMMRTRPTRYFYGDDSAIEAP